MFLRQEDDLEPLKHILAEHDYEYKSPVGRGGFATVHLVRSLRYNQDFCVKCIKNDILTDSLCEIETLMKLSGPNIIKMYEYFSDDKNMYIILEYCPGGSIQQYIKQNGPLPPQKLYHTCAQLLLALKQCHDNKVAHRDIKPGNVLIDSWGRPKLADFGLSNFYSENKESKSFAGSKAYMSPEILHKTAYDPFAADIWALGITFYYLAFGHLPWEGCDRNELELQISLGMIKIPNTPVIDNEFIIAIRRMTQVKASHRATFEMLFEFQIFKNQIAHIPASSLPPLPKAKTNRFSMPIENSATSREEPVQKTRLLRDRTLNIFPMTSIHDSTSQEQSSCNPPVHKIRSAQSGILPMFTPIKARKTNVSQLLKCITPQPLDGTHCIDMKPRLLNVI